MPPNTTLQAVRTSLLLSQEELAKRIKAWGEQAGEPNDANKRLVQRWESGDVTTPRNNYARALEAVTGRSIHDLGFTILFPQAQAKVREDGQGGHDVEQSTEGIAPIAPGPAPRTDPNVSYSGIWLSRYEYFSSGRDAKLLGLHYVVVIQHGHQLSVRSLPEGSMNPNSPLSMDLTLDGSVITGTWVEQTDPEGYYRGARYHGAIQMLVEPTGRRISGKWVGFGKDYDVNTGPWELVFQNGSTGQATMAKYNHTPEDKR